MKVGILTFHRATNYGAILQAYALAFYLKSIGHTVSFVDYKPASMALLYAPLDLPGVWRKLRRVVLNILLLPSLMKRWKKRKMFWEYVESNFLLTSKVHVSSDLPRFDAYVVGSDQVWSVCFTGGVDPFYWGQFDTQGAKLISYAGSAAENMDESFTTNDNARLLNVFDEISVREDELLKHLQKSLPNKRVEKVLDPTLMAGCACFEDLIKNEDPIETAYVLVYQVIRTKNDLIQQYAKQIAEQNSCDIWEIKDSRLFVNSDGKISISKNMIDPTQFVTLFKYAKFIITTSFHGTAFSLLFEKPFNVVSISPEVDSRAKDILHHLDLDDRLIELPCKDKQTGIDWTRVNSVLCELRYPSRDFLKRSLDGDVE